MTIGHMSTSREKCARAAYDKYAESKPGVAKEWRHLSEEQRQLWESIAVTSIVTHAAQKAVAAVERELELDCA